MSRSRPTHPRPLIMWLLVLIAMVYGIVIVGGLTRLTGSGLSMVDWKPIMGILPPLNEEQWQVAFDQYRQFPEYQKVNRGMSLEDFKYIFYWEYWHRIFGRLIGAAFFFPFLYFLIRRQIRGSWIFKFGGAFILGGLQGLLGWYMVQSGLVDEPRVSQYRLAAHFGLALLILAYLFWLVLELLPRRPVRNAPYGLKLWASIGLGLIVLQIFYGALTAGLNAGLVYNTFPDWNGQWLPSGLAQLTPVIVNFFENPVTVQLVHRTLAWLLLAVISYYMVLTFRKTREKRLRTAASLLFLALLTQFGLGVGTLLLRVPIHLASFHQAMAVAVLMLAIWNLYLYRNVRAR